MDFFERQEQAHRNTKLLVVYFVAGVAMLIAAVYLAVMLLFSLGSSHRHHRWRQYAEEPQVELWNPQVFLGVTAGTLAVIAIGSLFKTAELRRGGSAVAGMLGGTLVQSNTSDPDERRLLNVVEEMAIAAGIPVPQVYVLAQERGINAFAAGHSTSDAAISVTQGALKLLTRDELQGVIGHEFSHILNGDMRLNLRLMGIIFGILCLAVVGRILLQLRGSSRRDRNPLPILGLALLVIGWAGVFFGRLIQAAVSRQREFLADASAIQFTRNPAGLSGALKKIGGLCYGSKLVSAHAAEASHMFFGNGVGTSFLHLMDTHPSLKQRIQAIDPEFDGVFPHVGIAALGAGAVNASSLEEVAPELASNFWGTGTSSSILVEAPPAIALRTVMPHLGTPSTAHLTYAEGMRTSIPPALQTAAREPFGACTVVYALLLSSDENVRQKQLEELTSSISSAISQQTIRIWPEVNAVAQRAKLPLVDLALPALRQMSRPQFQQFRAAVQALVECDGEIDLFEYVLQKIVLRHLEPHFSENRGPVIQFYAIKPLAHDCAVLLSALAHVGQEDSEKKLFAFNQGAQSVSYAAQVNLQLLPEDQCDLSRLDAALDRLGQAVPQIKKNIITACAQTVAADGIIQELEAELLRAIADTLDCPIPPFVAEPA